MSPWKSKEIQRLHKFQRQFFEAKRKLCTQRLLLLVLTLLHKASTYFKCHGSATVIARVTVLTVLAFCSVPSENGQSHDACMTQHA